MLVCYTAFSLSIIVSLFVKDRPDYLDDSHAPLSFFDILSQLKGFMKDYKMWANGVYSGLLFACLSCFVAQWGPSFLSKATAMSFDDAATMCTMFTFGLVVACPLTSWLLPKIKNIKMVLSLMALGASILLSFVVMFPMMSHTSMAMCLFVCGICGVAYFIPFTIAHYYVRPGTKSTAIGFTNMLSTIFGPMLSLLIGVMIEHHHDAETTVYTLKDYQYGMNLLPMSMFFAALICFFLPATHRGALADDI